MENKKLLLKITNKQHSLLKEKAKKMGINTTNLIRLLIIKNLKEEA